MSVASMFFQTCSRCYVVLVINERHDLTGINRPRDVRPKKKSLKKLWQEKPKKFVSSIIRKQNRQSLQQTYPLG